jgi:hypothetical protein
MIVLGPKGWTVRKSSTAVSILREHPPDLSWTWGTPNYRVVSRWGMVQMTTSVLARSTVASSNPR